MPDKTKYLKHPLVNLFLIIIVVLFLFGVVWKNALAENNPLLMPQSPTGMKMIGIDENNDVVEVESHPIIFPWQRKKFTLTVESGTGSGKYKAGETVRIAAEVPEGKVFKIWTGDVDHLENETIAATTMNMPGEDAVVGALFEEEENHLFELPPIPELPVVVSPGKQYYVDNFKGNDSNNGSVDSPFRSIKHGVGRLDAGDTLLIVNNEDQPYDEAVLLYDLHGSADAWITIKSADGSKVQLRPQLRYSNNVFGTPRGILEVHKSSYIYLSGFRLSSPFDRFWAGLIIAEQEDVDHLFIENVEVDGEYRIREGILIGNVTTRDKLSNNLFFNYVESHSINGTGMVMRNPIWNFLVKNSKFYNNRAEEGNSGRQSDGVDGRSLPDHEHHSENIYFVNTEVYDNSGDGFDVGVKDGVLVFLNCRVINNGGTTNVGGQGVGFKLWSTNVWIVNNVAHRNQAGSIVLNPYWDSNLHVLHSTLFNQHQVGEISIGYNENRGITGKVEGYIFNNIIINHYRMIHVWNTNAHGSYTKVSAGNNLLLSQETNPIIYQFRNACNDTGGWVDVEVIRANDIEKVKNAEQHNPIFIGNVDFSEIFEDIGSGYFNLRPASPAIDMGYGVGVKSDIRNVNRPYGEGYDAGAHEFVHSSKNNIFSANQSNK